MPVTGQYSGAVHGPGILPLGHFDEAAVALVLNAVVDQQKGLRRIVQQWQQQGPQLVGGKGAVPQKPVHLVVAHARQMRRQVRARVVAGRTE